MFLTVDVAYSEGCMEHYYDFRGEYEGTRGSHREYNETSKVRNE